MVIFHSYVSSPEGKWYAPSLVQRLIHPGSIFFIPTGRITAKSKCLASSNESELCVWVGKIHIIYCQPVYVSLYIIYMCVCTFQKPPQQQKKQKNSGQPLKVWSLALAPSAPAFDIKDLTSPVAHPDSILGGQRARSFWLSVSLLWTLLSQSQVVNCHFFIGRKCKTRQKKHMKHSIV